MRYSLKCKRNAKHENPIVSKTSNRRRVFLSKCMVCNSKISRYINGQEATGFLSQFVIKNRFSEIPLLGNIFWKEYKSMLII